MEQRIARGGAFIEAWVKDEDMPIKDALGRKRRLSQANSLAPQHLPKKQKKKRCGPRFVDPFSSHPDDDRSLAFAAQYETLDSASAESGDSDTSAESFLSDINWNGSDMPMGEENNQFLGTVIPILFDSAEGVPVVCEELWMGALDGSKGFQVGAAPSPSKAAAPKTRIAPKSSRSLSEDCAGVEPAAPRHAIVAAEPAPQPTAAFAAAAPVAVLQVTAKAKAVPRKSKKRTKEESKAKHREVERSRTRRLNGLIARLKGEIQTSGLSVRKDKASVLESAIECIKHMRVSLSEVSNQLALANMRERAFLFSREPSFPQGAIGAVVSGRRLLAPVPRMAYSANPVQRAVPAPTAAPRPHACQGVSQYQHTQRQVSTLLPVTMHRSASSSPCQGLSPTALA